MQPFSYVALELLSVAGFRVTPNITITSEPSLGVWRLVRQEDSSILGAVEKSPRHGTGTAYNAGSLEQPFENEIESAGLKDGVLKCRD